MPGEWDPSKHPRADDGKFGEGSGDRVAALKAKTKSLKAATKKVNALASKAKTAAARRKVAAAQAKAKAKAAEVVASAKERAKALVAKAKARKVTGKTKDAKAKSKARIKEAVAKAKQKAADVVAKAKERAKAIVDKSKGVKKAKATNDEGIDKDARDAREVRQDVVAATARDFEPGGESGQRSPTRLDRADNATVGTSVQDAVESAPAADGFGPEKVFIDSVYDRLGGQKTGMTLDRFKTKLVELNRERRVSLARADLVGAMDLKKVGRSEIDSHGATFHFLLRRQPKFN